MECVICNSCNDRTYLGAYALNLNLMSKENSTSAPSVAELGSEISTKLDLIIEVPYEHSLLLYLYNTQYLHKQFYWPCFRPLNHRQ